MEVDFIFFFLTGLTRCYAFVESIEEMNGQRIAVHLDAIEADFFDGLEEKEVKTIETENLRVFRVVSTHKKPCQIMNDKESLVPGDWVEIECDNKESNAPRVWGLTIQNNQYTGDTNGRPYKSRIKNNSVS